MTTIAFQYRRVVALLFLCSGLWAGISQCHASPFGGESLTPSEVWDAIGGKLDWKAGIQEQIQEALSTAADTPLPSLSDARIAVLQASLEDYAEKRGYLTTTAAAQTHNITSSDLERFEGFWLVYIVLKAAEREDVPGDALPKWLSDFFPRLADNYIREIARYIPEELREAWEPLLAQLRGKFLESLEKTFFHHYQNEMSPFLREMPKKEFLDFVEEQFAESFAVNLDRAPESVNFKGRTEAELLEQLYGISIAALSIAVNQFLSPKSPYLRIETKWWGRAAVTSFGVADGIEYPYVYNLFIYDQKFHQ